MLRQTCYLIIIVHIIITFITTSTIIMLCYMI